MVATRLRLLSRTVKIKNKKINKIESWSKGGGDRQQKIEVKLIFVT